MTVHHRPSEVDQILEQACALHQQGKIEEAIRLYCRAMTFPRTPPELQCNLGIAYYQIDNMDEAINCFRQAILRAPKLANAHFFLGTALSRQGKHRLAADALKKAVDLAPTNLEAQTNLWISLDALGNNDETVAAFQQAIKDNPGHAETLFSYGLFLSRQQRYGEAAAAYRQCLALDPFATKAHNNLGSSLQSLDTSKAALSIACYRTAISLDPQNASAYANFCTIFERHGAAENAAHFIKRAVTLEPSPDNLSRLLFNLNYCEQQSPGQVAGQHFQVGELLEKQAAPFLLPARASLDRQRLRIGFVSPDLRNHAVSFFLKPLLRHRDRAKIEVFCYADVAAPDAVSGQLQGLSDHWLNTVGLSDDALAAHIRADEIDVLIDLAGHGPLNRLPVFARRPAPVQMTWLGYPNSTGLKSIDYRIVDAVTDPVGEADFCASEKLLRLPHGFLCYEPPAQAPMPALPAAGKDGAITFGSFNNPSKITTATFDLWAKLLHRLPTARLLLKYNRLKIGPLHDRLLASFSERGIAADRLIFRSGDADPQVHLAQYRDVDIALDPILYNGTTTSCDSLWMGVPVVTLRGNHHAARVGASLLTHLDLPSLIAEDADHYIEIAESLAADPVRLAGLRQELRARMTASPLCDGQAFARKFEAALLRIWTGEAVISTPSTAGTMTADSSADIVPQLTQASDLLALYAREPSRHTLSLLRDARNRLAASLLSVPAPSSFDPQKFTEINAAIGQAGLKIIIDDPQEIALLAQARRRLGQKGDALASGLLAHCLLSAAHAMPALPPLTDIPISWMRAVIGALYDEPIFWAANHEPARHLNFVERRTRSCLALLEGLAPEQLSSDLALLLLNDGRFTGCYFADKSLKSLACDRAGLTEHCLTLLGVAVDHAFPPSARPVLKLGCYRIHWQGNTEVAAMLAHLRGLDDRFDVTLYSNHPLGDTPCEQAARALAGTIKILPSDLPTSIAMMRADDLDIMLVGHNITAIASMPAFLYSCRLARLQVATTVCPSTTGLRSMDAFLNGAFNERTAAQEDYSERLLLAPGSINLYDFHDDDNAACPAFSRAQWAIPEDRFLFVSGANAYKITTELLRSWANILDRTENTQLLLYPFNPHWRDIYPRHAFESHIRKVMALEGIDPARITFLPPQPDRAHIQSILRLADLYLDSFPFSGAVSILDPLVAGLPMVLFQGEQARCRQSVGMHREFTLPAAIATSVGDYENLAITLANTPDKLAALRAEGAGCLARMRDGRLKIADLLYHAFQTYEQTS